MGYLHPSTTQDQQQNVILPALSPVIPLVRCEMWLFPVMVSIFRSVVLTSVMVGAIASKSTCEVVLPAMEVVTILVATTKATAGSPSSSTVASNTTATSTMHSVIVEPGKNNESQVKPKYLYPQPHTWCVHTQVEY